MNNPVNNPEITTSRPSLLQKQAADLTEAEQNKNWTNVSASLSVIESALLSNPLIEDCIVVIKKNQSSELEIIAYIVSSLPISPEQIQSKLENVIPKFLLPKAYVPVSSIPLTVAGQLDEATLLKLQVIDSDLIDSIEKQLNSLLEIERVAVVVEPQVKIIPPLHLEDLLPEIPAIVSEDNRIQIQAITSSQKIETNQNIESKKPAISHGEPLQYAENAPKTLAEVLQRAAEQSTNGIIYIQSDGSEKIQSYRELWQDAQRILAGLKKLGLKPQDKVIFQLEHNQDFISAFWGCVLGGFVPVPISIAPSYNQINSTTSKLQNVWQMLGKPLVLTSASLAPKIHDFSKLFNLENFQVEIIDNLCKSEPDFNFHNSQPEDLAILLLTSGSTGTPKAVMQSHSSLIGRSAGTTLMNGFTKEDVSLNWFPLDHVGGIIMFHFRDVFLGCQQIHAPIELVLQEPTKWLDWISHYRATITWSPNFAYGLINEQLEKLLTQRTPQWDLSSMGFILNAGEIIDAKTTRRFLQLLKSYQLPSTAMHPAWGMSETSSAVTYSDSFLLDSTTNEQKFVEVGAPIPGFAMRIVNTENQVVEEETIGQLQVKGASVTSGYYQNPQANQEAFTEDGWFNTGDLGTLRSGRLTITGRQKDVIIINGLNYYCHEIEAAVEEVDGVEISYTAACPVRVNASNTDKLAIFFNSQVADDQTLINLLKEIRTQVVNQIGINPDFLIPVDKEIIPKTAIGKIQRSQLSQRFHIGEFKPILKRIDILLGNSHTIPNWFYRQIWQPKSPLINKDYLNLINPTLVFLDSWGLGDYISRILSQYNLPYITVSSGENFLEINNSCYQISPKEAEHYQLLFNSLANKNIVVGQIIHLWTYDEYTGDIESLEALKLAQTPGIYSLLFLVQALAKVQDFDHSVKLLFISNHIQSILSTDLIAYEKSPVLGLIKTIPQELPWLDCRHIDLTFGEVEKNGDYILQELQISSKEREVAYRNGQRFVTRLEKVDLSKGPKHPIPFQQGGTYLLSGGLGGVGVEIAKYLLRNYQARLLLIGRTPLPEKSTWDLHLQKKDAISQPIKAYQELEQLGGEVIYEAVDICDLNNLQAIVEKAKNKWGKNLDGIIHLAGRFHEQFVLAETQENLSALLRPKMLGSWTLHQLIKDKKDSFFINFSSINSFFGGSAVSAYAAANSFLDCFSHYQKYQSALQSYCFAWSMWDEIGMSEGYQMKNLTRAKGFYAMPSSQAISSMLAALHHNQRHLFIGLDGNNRNISRWQVETESLQKLTAYFTASSPVEIDADFQVKDDFGTVCTCKLVQVSEIPLTENGAIDRDKLVRRFIRQETGALTAPRNEVEEKIAQIWQQVLNIPSLGIDDNFFELGGNSLLATQVISRIRKAFGVETSLQNLFQAPTIAQLSQLIEINNSQLSSASSLIQAIERTEDLPLSFAQTRLWFIDQYEGANAIYNIFQGLRLEGKLNIEALEKAVNALIVRHETLRTGFLSSEGEPVQIILPQLTLTIPVTDLGELSLEEQGLQVQHLVTQESHKPFDLKNPPLLRVSLFRLGATTHILLLTIHHIIADGWSMGVLNRELSHLYQAACKEETPSLPALPIQYADFAQWQRNWLQGDVLESQLSYWKQQLGGSLPVLELPTDHPRPAIQTYNGASISVELSLDLTNGLKALSQQEGVTLFMTLLAAFQILLYRYSGQEDIIVGTPIANRNRQEIEPLIGFFVNSLVLRTNLGGNPSFRELLKQVREVTLGAYTHQDLPFEKLVEEIQPERDLSRNPLFQVWFNMINFTGSTLLKLMDLKAENLLSQEIDSKFDLTLYLENKDKNIYLQLVYNKTLFNADTIEEMSKHFQQLLKVIVRNPEYPISNLSLLTETERYQLSCRRNLIQPSNPFTEFLKSDIKQSIPSRFQQQVEKYPHHFAIKTRNYEWTYEELNQQANNIAQQLLAYLPHEQIRIALLFEHDAPMIAAILGVLKLGQIYVTLDPDYPQDRVSYILEDSLASLIITNDHNFDKAQDLVGEKLRIINIDQIEITDIYEEINQKISADTIAYLLYTSGSTGQPKGVIQNHGNVIHFIRNYTNNLHISTQDKLTLFSSYSSDAAVIDIFGTLLNGATLYPFDLKQEGLANLSQWLREQEITIYHSTPTVYRYFLNSVTDKKDLEKIRLVVLGGETVVKQDVELYGEYFADDCIFVNGLGCTESSFNLQYLINKEIAIPGNSISVGYPFDDTEILLLDSDRMPTDIIGEIAIRSHHLALGYWRKPELTAEVFLPDPTGGKRRIYRTGDWGRFLPDGSLKFLGRKDFQVKIRGFRIELGEIEAVISKHPDVLNTVTIVREDIPGDKRLIAYIVLQPQGRLTQTELRQLVKQKLPDYMIPSAFVFLEKIPLTPNGKIDRRALPAPDSSRQDTAKAFLAPRDELELQLTKIWEKVLARKPIGVRDNFFDLGGHSLLGVKLLAQIQKSFPSNLPLSILFQAPTVEELAKVLRQKKVTPPWYSLVPIQPGGSRPILFGIHHIYFNDLSRYLGPEQPIYALHYAMAEATDRALSLPKMEDLAAHYIEEMRTLQPEGPYFLMGLSFGGVIAYEMAQQLVAQGQQVGLLALFDTHIQRGRKLLPLRQRVANLLRLPLPELMERVNGRVKAKLLVLRYGNQYLPHIYNREGMVATAKAYTPKPYPGRVNLFKAMDVSVSYVNYQVDPPEMGWRKFITGELEIHEVPGSHIGILEEPNIQILAEKLRVCMDKALGDFEV
ncbi:MAG: amino acid adenylation domain-containing protein [Dolichospermum sp. DL01]|nr:MAG: amino acid adenylation domain-containing protein [Dolichospermum sp. DL01]